MTKYIPRAGDVATDFVRCVYDEKLNSDDFKTFFNNGIKIWKENIRDEVDKKTREVVDKCIERFNDKSKNNIYRREDLYTASIFLQKYHIEQMLAGNPKYLR